MMTTHLEVLVYLLVLVHFAVSVDILGEGSVFKNSNLIRSRQYKNKGMNRYVRRPPANAPIEYLKTPNFDVMLLSEENSDPTWRKYSELFQPKDLRNAPQIEVNYGSNAATFVGGFRRPSIRLDRSEVESVLALLGSKKHIIVLHPRNCRPHSTAKGAKESSLDEFENEFLPKLLQQLHKPSIEQRLGSDMVDPVIDRILTILDKDEQNMLNELSKSFEGYSAQHPVESSMYSTGYSTTRRRPNAYNQFGSIRSRTTKKAETKSHLKNLLIPDPCNEGYVFLVQNQKNPMDPSSLNDLIMRVLKVVTEAS